MQRGAEARGPVEAPTVVTHGPPWSDVAAPGPLLPADALTEIPALIASRNASSTGSVYGVRAARDREVDDVDAVGDRLLHGGDRVGAEAALREADAVLDDARAGAMPQTGPRSTP